MGGAVVIPLVGLIFPIMLGIGAVGVGGAVVAYAAYRLMHDREHHSHFGWLHKPH